MICTSQFTFIHLHKAAGQSLSDALLNCIPGALEIGYHYPFEMLPVSASSLPIIGVVRNPWDWYVSWYAFNNLRGVRNPLFNIVSQGKQLGFKDTITNLIHYPDSSETSALNKAVHKSLLPDRFSDERGSGFTKQCVDKMESNTDGYYTMLVERMFGFDSHQLLLVPFENVVEAFCVTLERLGVVEASAVRTYLGGQALMNTSRHSHYSRYYDQELQELVRTRERRLLERFRYDFEHTSTPQPLINIDAIQRVPKLRGSAANFLKIGDNCETEGLAAALSELPDAVWAESDRQTVFDIHHETQSIPLLTDDMSHTFPVKGPQHPKFETLIQPILTQLASHFGSGGTFIRILFAKLNPRSQIRPHVDSGYSLINCNRVHIPIMTHPGVSFSVGGETLHMAEGQVWEINNAHVHAVRNDSDQARIHLIIDWTPSKTLLKDKKAFRKDLPMFYSQKFRTHGRL